MTDWPSRFLGLAQHIAQWSRDPSTQVGAVIVDTRNRIVSTGFNGFPRGIVDDDRLTNRSLKLDVIVHAETNALLDAGRRAVGCSMYVWPLPPCSRCAGLMIQAGVSRVVSPPASERWSASCDLASQMFDEAGVQQEVLG